LLAAQLQIGLEQNDAALPHNEHQTDFLFFSMDEIKLMSVFGEIKNLEQSSEFATKKYFRRRFVIRSSLARCVVVCKKKFSFTFL